MRQFIYPPQGNVRRLQQDLSAGNHFHARVSYPQSFQPSNGDVVFEIVQGEFVMHLLPAGLSYGGRDPWIHKIIRARAVRAMSLDSLFEQVGEHLGPELGLEVSKSALVGPVPPPRPQTDLPYARMLVCSHLTPPDAASMYSAVSASIQEQDDGLLLLSEHLTSFMARQHSTRPANALLLGSTGVGKTATAEVVASYLASLPEPYSYVRLDMNEMNLEHQTTRLTGAPPGYVGYQDTPEIIREVTRNPRLLVLVDELDKAHPQVLTVLMNVLASGRLTAAGQSSHSTPAADFSRSILLFTSNIATDEFVRLKSRCRDQGDPAFQDEVRARLIEHGMRPELAGRFQLFLIYNRITSDGLLQIVSLAMAALARDFDLSLHHISASILADVVIKVARSPANVRAIHHLLDRRLAPAFARYCAVIGYQSDVRIEGTTLNDLHVVPVPA